MNLYLELYDPTLSMLRPLDGIYKQRWISLAELCVWYAHHLQTCTVQQYERHEALDYLVKICNAEHMAWQFYCRRNGLRGGAPKHQTPWESTRSVKGMQLLTDIAHGDTPVPVIPLDEVTPSEYGHRPGS